MKSSALNKAPLRNTKIRATYLSNTDIRQSQLTTWLSGRTSAYTHARTD